MRRALPLLVLAAVVAGLAAWAGPRLAEMRRFHALFGLLQKYRDGDADAWSEPDRLELWASIHAYLDRDPEQLTRRLVDAVDAPDAPTREAAMVLAFELEYWKPMELRSRHGFPEVHLPRPVPRPRLELDRFRVGPWMARKADRFAARWDDEVPRTRWALMNLAPTDVPVFRETLARMAARDPLPDLRLAALHKLVDVTESAAHTALLRGLLEDPDPRVRWGAAARLACAGDPEGARRVVAGFLLAPPGVGFEDVWQAAYGLGRCHASLGGMAEATTAYLEAQPDGFAALPCDLRQPWDAWLALRESEGFAPEPQAARDAAYRGD